MKELEVRFVELLADKSARDGKLYTISEVEDSTGISRQRLYDWRDGKIKSAKLDEIEALCDFLECRSGDLIKYAPLSEGQERVARPVAA